MTHTVALLALLLYLIASGLMLFQVWRPEFVAGESGSSPVQVWSMRFFVGGFLAHTATLMAILQDPRVSFLDNGADYFFWVSWGLALAFAILARKLNYPIVGAFIVPAVMLFMGSSSYLLHMESKGVVAVEAPRSESLLSILHAIPAFVSMISLALAFVVSAVFLIVERRLKRRSSGALNLSGPNLQLLDSFNRRLAQLGFVAISLVVLSGSVWAVSEQKAVFSLDTSVLSGLLVWVLLAFILHVRLVLRWSPKRISKLTVLVTGVFFVCEFAALVWAGKLTHASLLS